MKALFAGLIPMLFLVRPGQAQSTPHDSLYYVRLQDGTVLYSTKVELVSSFSRGKYLLLEPSLSGTSGPVPMPTGYKTKVAGYPSIPNVIITRKPITGTGPRMDSDTGGGSDSGKNLTISEKGRTA